MPLLCASIFFPLQCIPWRLLGSTTLNRATGREVCSAGLCIKETEVPARHRGQNRRLHPSLTPVHPGQVEVPLAIASTSPMRQCVLFGHPSSSALSPMRDREAGERGWEKDGIDVSAPGRSPQTWLCVHQQNPGLVLHWMNPLLTAAGLAAPCLLFRALPCACRFCGWTDKGLFFSILPWLHLLASSELPSSLSMKFQNPAVELQFNNTMTEGYLYNGKSSHSEVLQPQSLPSAQQGPFSTSPILPPPGSCGVLSPHLTFSRLALCPTLISVMPS